MSLRPFHETVVSQLSGLDDGYDALCLIKLTVVTVVPPDHKKEVVEAAIKAAIKLHDKADDLQTEVVNLVVAHEGRAVLSDLYQVALKNDVYDPEFLTGLVNKFNECDGVELIETEVEAEGSVDSGGGEK